jgi:hypothetical protein
MTAAAARRILATAFAALLALGLLGFPAAAQTAASGEAVTATGVTPTDEAWFFRFRQVLPELPEGVADPTGGFFDVGRAEVRHRTNPFPLDTLHVGVLAGEPFARTFLGLSTFEVTDDMASIVGGVLRLVDNEEDSVNAAAADMVACLATDLVVPDDAGDWDAQPAFDCDVSSEAVLVEGADPLTWEIQLEPFAQAFADDLAPGLAIVERTAAEGGAAPDPRATWQVSLDASTRETAALAPDSTALITELERLARTVGDPETLLALVQDPESLPTFLVLQALPDVTAVYDQARVTRQTDPDRGLRPPTADLELVVTSFDDLDGVDGGFGDAGGDPAPIAADGVAPADQPAPTAGAFDAPAAAGSGFDGTGSSAGVADEVALGGEGDSDADEAAAVAADPEAARSEDAAGAPLGADAGSEPAGGGPGILLLLPLALGLAGALGWSLTSPSQLAVDRAGGALDRLTGRTGAPAA